MQQIYSKLNNVLFRMKSDIVEDWVTKKHYHEIRVFSFSEGNSIR